MKTFLNIFFYTSMLMVFSSCQKNIDSFIPDNLQNSADTVWQNNLSSNASVLSLKNDLKLASVTDSFYYSNIGIVYTSGNISLTIPANSLVKNNGFVPGGFVQRETSLSIKKGEFIARDLPTTSNGRLLVSGGAFYLNLKNNGENLSIAQGNKIAVKFNAANPVQGNKVFNISPDSSNGFNWILNGDTAFNKSATTINGYEIQTNKMQHILTAHFIDTAGIVQTMLSVKLPSNYTNTNTTAYISFNNIECVAGLKANIGLHSFISPLLPVNKPITIVIISKQAGDYYLGTLQVTTTLNATGSISIAPVKRSLEYIKTFLNSL